MMGFLGSYRLGLSPPKMPDCEVAREVLEAEAEALVVVTVLKRRLVTVEVAIAVYR